MNTNIIKKLFYALVICLLVFGTSSKSFAQFEGGYCGNDPITPTVVYSFLKHFQYEQFYWARDYMFTTSNNSYVDYMDFAYYCGHGAPFTIGCYNDGSNSSYIDLMDINSSTRDGFGNGWLKYIVLHSCSVIPSPMDTKNWWQGWVTGDGDMFDGLHMAIGFRTNARIATAPDIADFYGTKMATPNTSVLWSWVDAINTYGNHDSNCDFGSVVFFPTAKDDMYLGQKISTPDADSTLLDSWYQY